MPKITLAGLRDCTKFWVGITGLKNPIGDRPLNKVGPVVQSVSRDQVQRAPLNKRVNLSSESI